MRLGIECVLGQYPYRSLLELWDVFHLLINYFHMTATQSFASEDDQVESSSTAQNLSCEWIDVDQKCPDSNIRFYLYTQSNFDDKELIFIDDSRESSNLSSSSFNKNHETKIIIHGFRDDMFLTPLYDMKNGENQANWCLGLVDYQYLFFQRFYYSQNISIDLITTYFLWTGTTFRTYKFYVILRSFITFSMLENA